MNKGKSDRGVRMPESGVDDVAVDDTQFGDEGIDDISQDNKPPAPHGDPPPVGQPSDEQARKSDRRRATSS